jgi:hypothetical protein
MKRKAGSTPMDRFYLRKSASSADNKDGLFVLEEGYQFPSGRFEVVK